MTSEMRMSGAGYRLAGRAKTRVLRTALPLGVVFTTERTEENGRRRNCQPNTNPPRRRMRPIQRIFAHAASMGF
jgi:hypothetical protein